MDSGKKILFIRSGGGMPGLDIHAGINLALEKFGIRSTHNCGVSAGAAIAALDSYGHGPETIAAMIRNLTDEDVRAERLLWKLRIPFIDWFLGGEKIGLLLEKLLATRFDYLQKPLRVWTTKCVTGEEIIFDETSRVFLPEAVRASMAIKGIFPSVLINGFSYSDGGTNSNLPLPLDFLDFDEVWFLIATPPNEFPDRDGIISNLLLNAAWMMESQIQSTLEFASAMRALNKISPAKIFIIRPTCGSESSMLRFDHSLIYAAQAEAIAQISEQLKSRIETANESAVAKAMAGQAQEVQ